MLVIVCFEQDLLVCRQRLRYLTLFEVVNAVRQGVGHLTI